MNIFFGSAQKFLIDSINPFALFHLSLVWGFSFAIGKTVFELSFISNYFASIYDFAMPFTNSITIFPRIGETVGIGLLPLTMLLSIQEPTLIKTNFFLIENSFPLKQLILVKTPSILIRAIIVIPS